MLRGLVSLDGALGQLQPSGDVVLLDGSRLPASAASAASVADASVARKPLQHGSTAPSLPSADGAATVEPCTFDIAPRLHYTSFQAANPNDAEGNRRGHMRPR